MEDLELSLFVKINPENLATELAFNESNNNLIKIILKIDELIADVGFTKKLIKKLKKTLKEEYV